MHSPQKENGYTPIAHELLEAFYRCKLLEYERVVMLCIWRKTYGWNKKEDWISNSQFHKETGIPKPHITRTLKTLREKKIVTKDCRKVTINKNYWLWDVEWRVTSPGNTVTSPGNKKLPHQVPTKEKKETIQKGGDKSPTESDMNNWNKQSDDADMETVVDLDTGEVSNAPEKKRKKKTTDEMKAVFELFPNPAKKVWHQRQIQRDAAQILHDTYGLETLAKRIKRVSLEKKKGDPFLPHVSSPHELLDKMEALERYLGK